MFGTNTLLVIVAVTVAGVCGVLGLLMPQHTALWANVQWTWCFCMGPLLAWRSLPGWGQASSAQRAFLLGLGLYALGQLVYLSQVLADFNPSPAPSDMLFLALLPLVAVGLAQTIRGLNGVTRAERIAIVADALCVFLGVLTVVLALYLPRVSELSAFDVAVMTAYPAGFFSLGGAALIIMLATACALGRRSPLIFLLGLMLSALCWVVYNEVAFGDGDLHYPLTATGFSLGMLCMGLGVGGWRLEPSASAAWRRGSFLTLRILPLLLVAAAAAAIALPEVDDQPLINAAILSGALIVIAVAMLRQGLMLWERDRLLMAEEHLRQARQESETLTQRLRDAERLEAIGRLAGGVAHDFNNLLAALLGHVELAMHKVEQGSPLHAHLKAINKAGERGAELVSQLLGFARRQFAEPKPTDFNTLLAEADQLLRRTLGEHIEVEVHPATEAVVAMVDPGQMMQVILNLASNARDAMPTGGKMTIEVAAVELDAHYCQQYPDVSPGPYCLLAISDTGVGIAAKDLGRVFEPFFTTKDTHAGTGLGLASCHGIIKQHGGHVSIYSEPDRGTTVKAYLPRVEIAAESSSQSRPAVRRVLAHAQQYCILVCEDDAQIRSLITGVLTDLGYQLLVASNGQEALDIAAAHQGSIDLLLSDVVMPQMGGAEVAQRLKERFPHMRVLFISGYTENVVVRQGVLKPGISLLQKPFSIDQLLDRVAAELTSLKH